MLILKYVTGHLICSGIGSDRYVCALRGQKLEELCEKFDSRTSSISFERGVRKIFCAGQGEEG